MPRLPRWLLPLNVVLVAAALLPPAMISRARTTKSASPRINLVPDMDYQPKFLPQTENPLFADGRAMRPEIEGTIARGALREDDHLYRGRVAEEWASAIPVPVTRELMQRGQQRFEIYCAPCHGLSGFGDGLVARRADELALSGHAVWTPPTSMHDETVRGRPVGHLFNTITFGIRTMPAYGTQIAVEDRWAIVAYLRALQRSSGATIEDVPESVRSTLR